VKTLEIVTKHIGTGDELAGILTQHGLDLECKMSLYEDMALDWQEEATDLRAALVSLHCLLEANTDPIRDWYRNESGGMREEVIKALGYK
jgi:hypothetical protein